MRGVNRRALRVVVLVTTVVVGLSTALVTASPSEAASTPSGPVDPVGTYRPVAPFRAVDRLTVGAGQVKAVLVGRPNHGLPSGGGYAAAVNVTVLDVTAWSYVTVFPHGQAVPGTSTANVVAGSTTATAAVVPVSADGSIDVFNAFGSVHVIVDVVGFYPAGPTFAAVSPSRVLDTRKGGPTVDGRFSGVGKVAGGQSVSVPVAGRAGVPTSGVAGVYVSVTAVAPSQGTYVTAYPSGKPVPVASTVNPGAGQIVANLAFVPVGAGGAVSLFNAFGATDLILDVVGYVKTTGTTFHPLSPTRFVDTRPGASTFDGKAQGGGPLPSGTVLSQPMAGRAGIPTSATSVIVNVTAIPTNYGGYLSVGSSVEEGWSPVAVSTLNYGNAITTNLAVVPLDVNGNLSTYLLGGSLNLILDVVGWSDAVVGPTAGLVVGPAAGQSHPFFDLLDLSGDASTVAYVAQADGLFLVDRTTRTPTRVAAADDAVQGVLSDDGSTLVVTQLANPLSPGTPSTGYYGVYAYNRSTKAWTRVSPVADQHFSNPSVSADGNTVVYTEETSDADHAWVWDRGTGTRTQLVDAKGAPINTDLALVSANGRFIVFTSPNDQLVPGLPPNPSGRVYLLDRTSSSLAALPDAGSRSLQAISTDGNVIAYGGVVLDRSTKQTYPAKGVLSGDGRFELGQDTEGRLVRTEVRTGASVLVASNRAGGEPWPGVDREKLSNDGQTVVFTSQSVQLGVAPPLTVRTSRVYDVAVGS